MGAIRVDEARPGDNAVRAAIDLSKRHKSTLGLMPAGAFEEAAYRGGLLVASVDDVVTGYALFRLPRNNKVALSHLCVSQEARGTGVARALIEEIKERHASRWGIRAKCRDDYALSTMWESLGFQATGKARGRGKDRSPMTVWWLDHEHPDLFTSLTETDLPDDEPDLLEAALDLNILMDLQVGDDSSTSERSHVLIADHLVGRLRLVVTGGVERELAGREQEQRAPVEQAANQYPRRTGAAGDAEELHAQLVRASAGQELSEQDERDLWQIAETVSSGVAVLLTWDDRLRERFDELQRTVPALASFHVFDPDHLVAYLDEVAQAWAYQPARLQGSDYDQVRAGADDEPRLLAFLNHSSGEDSGELRDLLRRLAREEVPRWLIRSGDEPAIACYAAHLDGKILRVPLLRTSHHRLSDTIARQLLWLLRRDARKHGAQVIDISDRRTDEVTARAMSSAPFHEHDGHQYAWVVDVCGTNQEIDLAADAARELVGLGRGPLLRPGLPARTASEVERSLWPAKLTDSELPHYVIPVQPRWSSDLLGHPLQLTSRRIELSLGRGQVYYRSADNLLTAPARIIWRVSKGRHTAAEIIGTSFLDTITTGTPKRLHATFEHYGVLDLDQLEKQADGKQLMQALQFSDTELFERPISTRTYEQLKARHGGPENFPGPRSITPELFAALYRAGNE